MKTHTNHIIKIIPILLGIIFLFFSCTKNEIEKINSITDKSNLPDLRIENTEIIYSEYGKTKTKLISPLIKRYINIEKPYTEFPKGIHVFFYDSLQNEIASIRSNYAINNESENLWIAENDVQVVNTKGDTLNTEYLTWNQKKKKIYTDEYVRMTYKDGIIHGKGLEANEDLTNWEIQNISGIINIDNKK